LSWFSFPEIEVVNAEGFKPMGKPFLASLDPLGDGGDVSRLFEEEFDNLVRLSVVDAPKNDAFHGMISSSDFAGSPKRFGEGLETGLPAEAALKFHWIL